MQVCAAILFALVLCLRGGDVCRGADSSAVQIDPKLPAYEKSSGEVSGDIKSVGSDTMAALAQLWAEAFKRNYPDVRIEIESKGSSNAPLALVAGTANFGPMSREWDASEIDEFEKKFGYKPTSLRAALDVLAVYVNKDCPLDRLTLQQVDAIFSITRKGGASKDITKWGDLGLTGEWANKPISLYGRNATSGTYRYFKDNAMFRGDFKPTVKEQPGSSAVVNGVANDRYGIGYSGIGSKTADVKALALDSGKGPIEAVPQNAYNGTYSMARPLLMSLNYKPGSELDPLRREFIRFILSQDGQREVVKAGYLPITAAVADKQLLKVGIKPAAAGAVKTSVEKGRQE
jgi:phosphate transport system substrate-binding protein